MDAVSDFLDHFESIRGTGSFACTGAERFFLPGLLVDGIGEISFPLGAAQARKLAAVAAVAPYGKGQDTVFDDGVRKCRQIDASRFSLESPEWTTYLKNVVGKVAAELGIAGKVSAHPYKLLIYEPGGHFKAHRDTEKLSAMFGTLIIALPSAHRGGLLRIRHEGQEVVVDFANPGMRNQLQHAAFFADCEHEVEQVLSGFRCCLVYNLCLDKGSPAALNRPLSELAADLIQPLEALALHRRGNLAAILLEHQYTEANFSITGLKGSDWVRTAALMAAAEEVGLDVHLALAELQRTGTLEVDYPSYRRRYDDDEDDGADDGEMGEVIEESLSLDHWRDASDQPVKLRSFAIDGEAIIAREELGTGEPDDAEIEAYTGNAGATVDHWYRRAAIVIWSRSDRDTLLANYDLPASCERLLSLARDAGPTEEFESMARAVLQHFPSALPHPSSYKWLTKERSEPFLLLLEAVAKAQANHYLSKLLETVPPDAFVLCDSALWSRLLRAFGPDPFNDLINLQMSSDGEHARTTLFRILAATNRHDRSLVELGARLATHLSSLPVRSAADRLEDAAGQTVSVGCKEEAAALLGAPRPPSQLEARAGALTFLQADGSAAYVLETLGPVLLEFRPREARANPQFLFGEVLKFAIEVLGQEVAKPLNPYPNWSRPFTIRKPSHPVLTSVLRSSNRPGSMKELEAFMADPEAPEYRFACPQGERSSLEEFIRRQALDLDCATVRAGRPYSLVCRKNDNSYLRALAQRARMEEMRAQLEQLTRA